MKQSIAQPSLKITLEDRHVAAIEKVITKNLRSILAHSRSVGVRTVPDWESYLTEDALLRSSNTAVSQADNLISFERLGIHRKITSVISEAFPQYKVSPSGFFHYPPTGYMGWHTNSDVPCKRMYITWAAHGGKSFFRYVQEGQVITDYDNAGLTFRVFDIQDKPPYLWHCVGSETDRISIGYRLNAPHNDG